MRKRPEYLFDLPFRADMLMELVELLRDLHPRKKIPENGIFDMSTYSQVRSCNTSACAMGWGVYQLPKFRSRYYLSDGSLLLNQEKLGQYPRGTDVHDVSVPLGITPEEYHNLFLPGSDRYHNKVTPRGVAMEIERFIKRKIKMCTQTGQKVRLPT